MPGALVAGDPVCWKQQYFEPNEGKHHWNGSGSYAHAFAKEGIHRLGALKSLEEERRKWNEWQACWKAYMHEENKLQLQE